MLINLEEDSVQYETWGLGHVQGLFSLGQPVDGVLQRGLETCCQGNGLIQLCLESSEFKVNNKPTTISQYLSNRDDFIDKDIINPEQNRSNKTFSMRLTLRSSILVLRLAHLFCSMARFCWVWVVPGPASSPPRASNMDSP